MMICPNCQNEIRDNAKFCEHCGARLDQAKSSSALAETIVTTAPPAETIATAAPPLDPLIGRVLAGKYELLEKLGQGGMGAVYLARRIEIDDTVAVKILNANLVADTEAVARFQREAKAAARLNKCPNAVTIYDFGRTEDGLVYLVMELLKGRTLGEELKKEGRLPIDRTVEIMEQICKAVDEAHRLGIIHRDLKPDNIVLEQVRDGEIVKVVDFGIAKLCELTPGSPQLTQAGLVVGTPTYMSPEQCRGDELDPSSDIYSLGIILYEMLAGVVPFKGSTPTAIMVQHMRDDPPPIRKVCPDIPQAIEEVVMRALAKDPKSRQQSAKQLAQELRDTSPQQTQVIRPPAYDHDEKDQRSLIHKFVRMGIGTAVVSIVLIIAVIITSTSPKHGNENVVTNPDDKGEVTGGKHGGTSDSRVSSSGGGGDGGGGSGEASGEKSTSSPGRHSMRSPSDGKTGSESTNLDTPERVTLRIQSTPPQCTVSINGISRGTTNPQGSLSIPDLQPGSYTIEITHEWYEPWSDDIELPRPQPLSVTLDPTPPEILLERARDKYEEREYGNVIRICRRILEIQNDQPRAVEYLAKSHLALGHSEDAVNYFVRTVELGRPVKFHLKHHHGKLGFESMCQGDITIARDQISFLSHSNASHHFQVPLTNLIQCAVRGDPARLHMRVRIGKKKKKNFNFYAPGARMVPVEQGSLLREVRCNDCRAYVEVIYELLMRIRGEME